MGTVKVGLPYFCEHFESYVAAETPIEITRAGEVVGYYIPANQRQRLKDLLALGAATARMDDMLSEAGITKQELVEDYRRLRRPGRRD